MPVPGFEWDVFISYARANDRDAPERFGGRSDVGWVAHFQRRLEDAINGRCATDVKVWYDKSAIARGEGFSDAIAEGASRSAVFVALLSTRYLASEYCNQEVSTFFEQDSGLFPFMIGRKCRLVTVLLEDIVPGAYEARVRPHESSAQQYAREAYRMFQSEEGGVSHRARCSSESSREYYEMELTRLACFIASLLRDMREAAPSYADIVRRSRPQHLCGKFLCIDALHERHYHADGAPKEHVGDELRKQVRSALDQKKINVIDLQKPGDLPLEAYAGAVAAALERAHVVLHIIDIDREGRFSDEAFAQLERCTAQAAKFDKARVVWISDRTLTASLPEQQGNFIKQLRTRNDANLRVVCGDARTLISELETALGTTRPAYDKSNRQLSWYITYQMKDKLHKDDICARLEELGEENIYAYPICEAAGSNLTSLHRVRLRSCEGLVFVYSGESSNDWAILHRYGVDLVANLRKSGKVGQRPVLIYEPARPPGVNVENGVKARLWRVARGPLDPTIDETVHDINDQDADLELRRA
jgi:hypothetical protein